MWHIRPISAVLLGALLGVGIWVTRSVGYSAAGATDRPPQEALPQFDRVPLRVGNWVGKPEPIGEDEQDLMGVDAALSRVYQGPTRTVRFLVEARVGKSRDQFHMPMVCMTSNGWSTLKSGVQTIHPKGFAKPVETTWLFMTQAGQYMAIRYWLWKDGHYTAGPSGVWRQLNAVAAWERLRNADPKGALFLCYTPVDRAEDADAALASQTDFAEAVLPSVDQTLQSNAGLLDR
jgi:EpsI family protein